MQHFSLIPSNYIFVFLCLLSFSVAFYVHGSLHRDSVSIIVQRDATMYSFIMFLQTPLHVLDDTLIHCQEHTQTVITTSGTGQTIFATIR